MFGSLGLPEILLILVLALLLFGPKRLPEIGRTLGKGLSEFRRASNELRRTLDAEVAAADAPPKPQPVPPALREPAPKPSPPTPESATSPRPGAEKPPSAESSDETPRPAEPDGER